MMAAMSWSIVPGQLTRPSSEAVAAPHRDDVSAGDVFQKHPISDGWRIATLSLPFSPPCQIVIDQEEHLTEVRLSDRERYVFGDPLVVETLDQVLGVDRLTQEIHHRIERIIGMVDQNILPAHDIKQITILLVIL